MELFTINEQYYPVVNKPDVFLIKEFKELFDEQRCKGVRGDPNGKLKFRAFRELAYIYLMYDWKTPYSEYSTVTLVRNSARFSIFLVVSASFSSRPV